MCDVCLGFSFFTCRMEIITSASRGSQSRPSSTRPCPVPLSPWTNVFWAWAVTEDLHGGWRSLGTISSFPHTSFLSPINTSFTSARWLHLVTAGKPTVLSTCSQRVNRARDMAWPAPPLPDNAAQVGPSLTYFMSQSKPTREGARSALLSSWLCPSLASPSLVFGSCKPWPCGAPL